MCAGSGRLPVWVVRMRSVLRFITPNFLSYRRVSVTMLVADGNITWQITPGEIDFNFGAALEIGPSHNPD
jgi:hypothetical protein